MTQIQKSKPFYGLEKEKPTVCRYWILEFICNLVLGICDFRHKTPRQSPRPLTWPKGPGFSEQNKGIGVNKGDLLRHKGSC
jgi:hypothetical protein